MLQSLLMTPDTAVTYPGPEILAPLLAESSARHRHLCPRQVLGARMGLLGLRVLGFIEPDYLPRFDNEKKRLLTIIETDGCGASGVAAATDCHVGRRTLRVLDYGKMAITMVDTRTEQAVRIIPRLDVRESVYRYAPDARSHWHAYLEGYQIMPDGELLQAQPVVLTQSITEIISRPGVRVNCEICGEEIINEREIIQDGRLLCRHCAGDVYFRRI
ncbi:MAG: FmdE family protein [Anaerolineae bacterium]